MANPAYNDVRQLIIGTVIESLEKITDNSHKCKGGQEINAEGGGVDWVFINKS